MRREDVLREFSLLALLMRSTPAVCDAFRLAPEAMGTPQASDVMAAILEASRAVRANPDRWSGRLSPRLVENVLRAQGVKWLDDSAEHERVFKAEQTIDERRIWGEVTKRYACRLARETVVALSEAAGRDDYAGVLDELAKVRAWIPPSTEPNRRAYAYTAQGLAAKTMEYMIASSQRKPVNVPLIGGALASVVPGAMGIIGGDTNTGKSGLMLYLAKAYEAAGRRVGIISLEDPAHVWGDRLQASYSGVSILSAMRRGFRHENDRGDVEHAIERLADVKMTVSVMPSSDLTIVMDEFRALALDGCEVIFVDYVQEVTDEALAEERRLLVTKAATCLKAEAQERGVMLFLGSQLSRTAEHRRGKNEPNARALKESGELENKAEMIILLWRESDDSHAPTLGKIAKDKSDPSRPRFQVERNDAGSIVALVEPPVVNEPEPVKPHYRRAS